MLGCVGQVAPSFRNIVVNVQGATLGSWVRIPPERAIATDAITHTLFCSSRVVEVDAITITVIRVEGEGQREGVDAAHAGADEGDELLE